MAEDDPFAGIEDVFPASPGQAGMLFETLATPDYPANRGLMIARLPADLDVTRFQAVWAEVIARHQALRSRLLWEGLSEPVLVIEEEVTPAWERLDWRGTDAAAALENLCDSLRAAPFDLSATPTMRQVLARGDDGYTFVWLIHHALMDDWSVEVVFRETAALYASEDLPPAMPYRDFADWRAGQVDDGYWAQVMAGFEGPTRLGFAAPDAAHAGQPHMVSQASLPIEPLAEVARAMRVTLGAVLTTVWSLVVQRLSGGADVAFGLAATERPADLPGAARAVGLFVATQPARLELDERATLRELIHARNVALQAAQGRPAPLLADLAGDGGEAPFDTILSIKETGMGGAQALYSDITVRSHSSFPLALVMRPEDELGLIALWSPDRFSARDMDVLLATLRAALLAVPNALDAPAMMLGIADADEQGAALDTARLIPEAIAQADPQAVAIEDVGGATSYAALEAQTQALAAQLQAFGVRPGDRVAVLMPRGAACIAGFLAAWRVGAAYVPLDPAQPDDRLQQMVTEGRVRAILTDAALAGRVTGPVLTADPGFDGPLKPQAAGAKDVAYVMFTSGSTGVPKGVVVSHGNLAASTAARPVWYGDRPERFMVVSPFGFDSSVAGIYWTLAEGGTLVVPQAEVVRDVPALAALVQVLRVTHTLCLPSLYDLLLGHADRLASLRCTIIAGEPATPELVARHHMRRPDARLINEYGPTEATVWCVASDLVAAEGPVPIGTAIPGVTLRIRDAMARAVPDGLPGELWVAGPGVARYLHGDDPAFVTEGKMRFYRTGDQVRRGPDGQLQFLGRNDQQVKIGGHRVELGEVEARLMAMPGVNAAAVVAIGPANGLRLVAYIVGAAPDVRALPAAMRPAYVVALDALPQTSTGKVDRKALMARGMPQAQAVEAPVGETEARLAILWQEMLGLMDVPDVTTGFFALGGTSLMAMRLVAAVAEQFDRPVTLPQILGPANTIRKLAAQLDSAGPAVARVDPDYPAPATESQKALWLAAKMRPGVPYFNLAKAVRLDRAVGFAELETAAARLIAQHGILGCTLTLANRQLTLTPIPDLPPIEVSAGDGDVEGWLHAQTQHAFVMDGSPLWRIAAMPQCGATVICVGIHHTISDGWSLDTLIQDLVAVLNGRALPAPTRRFAAVAAPTDTARDIAQWAEMLKSAPYGPRLTTDRPLPDRSDSAGVLAQMAVPDRAQKAMMQLAAAENTTPFAALWAATALWLGEETGQRDSLMAVSHAGRSAAGFERTVGCFTNALPYRLDLSDNPDLRAATARAGATAARILAHEDVSIGALPLPAADVPRGYLSSFAPIALQFNDFDWTGGATNDGAEPVEFTPTLTSYFEVSLEWAVRRGVLHCAILARADIYDQATVDGWVQRLVGFVERQT